MGHFACVEIFQGDKENFHQYDKRSDLVVHVCVFYFVKSYVHDFIELTLFKRNFLYFSYFFADIGYYFIDTYVPKRNENKLK